jgi:hypothetical protein
MTIEAIFFKIRNLLLEWSGQLIFLGLLTRHLNMPCSGLQRRFDALLQAGTLRLNMAYSGAGLIATFGNPESTDSD